MKKKQLPSSQEASPLSTKFLSFSRSFIAWFSAVLLFLLTAFALFSTAYMKQKEIVFYKWDFFPLTLLLILCVLAALLWMYRRRVWEKIPLSKLQTALTAFVLVAGTTWVFMSRNQPYADAQYVYGYAQWFLLEDFSTIPENYLRHFPYQLSLALYYELIMRLVGPDCFYYLQMINVGSVALSYLLLNRIAGELFFEKEATQFFCCLFLFGCLPPIIFSAFVYSTQLGLTPALLSLYLTLRFLRDRKKRWLILTMPAIAFAVTIKQNYWIFLIAILIFLFLDFIKTHAKSALAGVACLLAGAFLAPQLLYLSYELRSGYDIQPGSPPIVHIAMGMQESERAPGWYNGYVLFVDYGENALHLYDGDPRGYAAAQARQDIDARMDEFAADPLYALNFYTLKIASQWSDPTFAAIQVSYFGGRNIPPLAYLPTALYWGGLRAPVEFVMEIYLVFIYAGALVFFIANRKKHNLPALLPVVVIIGGFLFHLLWEAKSQYCWPYFILCVPYAAAGWCSLLEWANDKIPHRKKKNKQPAVDVQE